MDVLNFMIKIDHMKIILYILVQIKDYHYLQKIDLTKFKKIGFVRKHIDRLMSVYKFDKLDTNFYEKYNPLYNPVSSKSSFNEFLIHIKNKKFYNNTHYNLDKYYLNKNKKLVIDELYDFHNFNSEITRLF